MTRYLILLSFLGLGACTALTPSEVKNAVAVAHRDLDVIQRSLRAVDADLAALGTANAALLRSALRNLDAVAANVSTADALVNK